MSKVWALKPRQQRKLLAAWGFHRLNTNGGHETWARDGQKVTLSMSKAQAISTRRAAEIVGVTIHEFLAGPSKPERVKVAVAVAEAVAVAAPATAAVATAMEPLPELRQLTEPDRQKGVAVAKPTVIIEKITPHRAEEYLRANSRNRNLRERRVNSLVEIIGRGEWQLTNDAVAFDPHGVLLNGQHRLAAIVKSGVACEMMVIRGIDAKSQLTMDMGLKRNLADELRIEGFSNPLPLAAAINVKWRLDNDLVRNTSMAPTVLQALQLFEKNPDLAEAVRWAVNKYVPRLRGSVGVMAVAYHEFMRRDPDAASAFFESLTEGTNLKAGSPILLLRRALEGGHISPVMQFALVIKAWNHYLDGKQLAHLTWRPVGKFPEAFPEIQG